jgi:hypothetical protein
MPSRTDSIRRRAKRERLAPVYSLNDPEFCEGARRFVFGIVGFKVRRWAKNVNGKPLGRKITVHILPRA